MFAERHFLPRGWNGSSAAVTTPGGLHQTLLMWGGLSGSTLAHCKSHFSDDPWNRFVETLGGIWCLWSQRPVCQPLSAEFPVLEEVGFSLRNMDHFHAFWPVFLHKFTWLLIIFYNTGKECSSPCLKVHCPQYTEIIDFFSVKKRYLKMDTFIHLLKRFVRAIKPSPERVVNLWLFWTV